MAKAVNALLGVLKSCGLWTFAKIDKGLDAASVAAGKVGGTAVGVAGVAWVTQNGDKIQKLIEAAQDC